VDPKSNTDGSNAASSRLLSRVDDTSDVPKKCRNFVDPNYSIVDEESYNDAKNSGGESDVSRLHLGILLWKAFYESAPTHSKLWQKETSKATGNHQGDTVSEQPRKLQPGKSGSVLKVSFSELFDIFLTLVLALENVESPVRDLGENVQKEFDDQDGLLGFLGECLGWKIYQKSDVYETLKWLTSAVDESGVEKAQGEPLLSSRKISVDLLELVIDVDITQRIRGWWDEINKKLGRGQKFDQKLIEGVEVVFYAFLGQVFQKVLEADLFLLSVLNDVKFELVQRYKEIHSFVRTKSERQSRTDSVTTAFQSLRNSVVAVMHGGLVIENSVAGLHDELMQLYAPVIAEVRSGGKFSTMDDPVAALVVDESLDSKKRRPSEKRRKSILNFDEHLSLANDREVKRFLIEELSVRSAELAAQSSGSNLDGSTSEVQDERYHHRSSSTKYDAGNAVLYSGNTFSYYIHGPGRSSSSSSSYSPESSSLVFQNLTSGREIYMHNSKSATTPELQSSGTAVMRAPLISDAGLAGFSMCSQESGKVCFLHVKRRSRLFTRLEMFSKRKRSSILFSHIPKNGGTNMKFYLKSANAHASESHDSHHILGRLLVEELVGRASKRNMNVASVASIASGINEVDIVGQTIYYTSSAQIFEETLRRELKIRPWLAIVRNPYSWLYSVYKWLCVTYTAAICFGADDDKQAQEADAEASFEKFVMQLGRQFDIEQASHNASAVCKNQFHDRPATTAFEYLVDIDKLSGLDAEKEELVKTASGDDRIPTLILDQFQKTKLHSTDVMRLEDLGEMFHSFAVKFELVGSDNAHLVLKERRGWAVNLEKRNANEDLNSESNWRHTLYTTEMRKVVEKLYQDDLEFFGYSFEQFLEMEESAGAGVGES